MTKMKKNTEKMNFLWEMFGGSEKMYYLCTLFSVLCRSRMCVIRGANGMSGFPKLRQKGP